MKLTHEILHSAGTSGTGFNKHQLQVLGVEWPPARGWLNALIGSEVSDETWQLVVQLRGVRQKRTRDEIVFKHNLLTSAEKQNP